MKYSIDTENKVVELIEATVAELKDIIYRFDDDWKIKGKTEILTAVVPSPQPYQPYQPQQPYPWNPKVGDIFYTGYTTHSQRQTDDSK